MEETESLAPHRAAHLFLPFIYVRAAGLGEIISCLKRAIKNASTNGSEASRGCWKMPDAGRVAPISACVSYQIDSLKSRHCYARELRSNGSVFNWNILARRIATISVSISTRHLQYFFYRLDIYFDRLGLICNHIRPCAFYDGWNLWHFYITLLV